jgi:hypothetical protein
VLEQGCVDGVQRFQGFVLFAVRENNRGQFMVSQHFSHHRQVQGRDSLVADDHDLAAMDIFCQ